MGIHIKVLQDNCDGDSPREWDPPSTMACWHNRLILGDVQPRETPEEWLAENAPEGSVVLPLFLYEHGGITMSASEFSCGWDSGQVGVLVCTPESIAKEWNGDKEAAKSYMLGEVVVYDQYLRGDVWGYVIEKDVDACETCAHTPERDHVDSCWGFYAEGALEAMKEHVDDDLHEKLTEAWENRGG